MNTEPAQLKYHMQVQPSLYKGQNRPENGVRRPINTFLQETNKL